MSLIYNGQELPYMYWNGNPTSGFYNGTQVWPVVLPSQSGWYGKYFQTNNVLYDLNNYIMDRGGTFEVEPLVYSFVYRASFEGGKLRVQPSAVNFPKSAAKLYDSHMAPLFVAPITYRGYEQMYSQYFTNDFINMLHDAGYVVAGNDFELNVGGGFYCGYSGNNIANTQYSNGSLDIYPGFLSGWGNETDNYTNTNFTSAGFSNISATNGVTYLTIAEKNNNFALYSRDITACSWSSVSSDVVQTISSTPVSGEITLTSYRNTSPDGMMMYAFDASVYPSAAGDSTVFPLE